jgi:casein kinase 1 alpha
MTSNTKTSFAPGHKIDAFVIAGYAGGGRSSDVYCVEAMGGHTFFAMKVQPISTTQPALTHELKFLERLRGSPSFPTVFISGVTDTHQYFVMELLGPSLSNTRRLMYKRHFSLETTLRLSLLMFNCIRECHGRGIVHGDINPGNFLLRPGSRRPLTLIDFGFSKDYIDTTTGRPLPERGFVGSSGTPKYASLFVHEGQDQCPRDDLISWLYSVIELFHGYLPWSQDIDLQVIQSTKKAISDSELLPGLPDEFAQIMRYVNRLKYDSIVKYDSILRLLIQVITKKCPDISIPFDWETISRSRLRTITDVEKLPTAQKCSTRFQVQVQKSIERRCSVKRDACCIA